MREIRGYKEVDCKVMTGIARYLRGRRSRNRTLRYSPTSHSSSIPSWLAKGDCTANFPLGGDTVGGCPLHPWVGRQAFRRL